MSGTACRACGARSLEEVPELAALGRVTSDCRPWPPGGHLAACSSCGLVQKPHEPDWEAGCRAIYSRYELYTQSAGGVEQAVYEPSSGMPATRSERLLERIHAFASIAEEGRLLDVGCGNGAFLRAFHARAPKWSLNGTDVHEGHKRDVESIPGVEGFHRMAPEEVAGRFDWITMLHVLEHVPSPVEFLERLRAKLAPGARLVIEVPDHRSWPFDLAIADHASHFSKETLGALLARAGYVEEALVNDWIPRELTALARAGAGPARAASSARGALEGARSSVFWLARVAEQARALAKGPRSLAIFGSSIGATWLAAQVEGAVACFVDEDPSRDGRSHMGVPILAPDAAPAEVPLYVALPPSQVGAVHARLATRRPELRLVCPPELGYSK